MTACAPAGPNSYATKRQIQVIVNNHHLSARGAKFPQQPFNRLAAAIHVSLGFDEQNFFAREYPLPDQRIATFLVNGYTLLCSDMVNDSKPNVVPRVLILFPGVAKSHDKLHRSFPEYGKKFEDQDSSASSFASASGTATASPSTATAGAVGAASTVGGTTVTMAKLDS
jgi:hypothetical protein